MCSCLANVALASPRVAGLVLLGLCAGAHAQLAVSSGPASPGVTAAGGSFHPMFSADGNTLSFLSFANNLVAGDEPAGRLNVFLKDLVSHQIELVSANLHGARGGNADSHSQVLSADGEFVAFVSEAGDLVSNDTNQASDVFLRDRGSQETLLITRPASGAGSALGDFGIGNFALSEAPEISADGRWISFESRATNLVDLPDANAAVDVFVRDRLNEVTYLVSRNAAGTGSANGPSHEHSMSAAGSRIAFASRATDLIPQVAEEVGHVFVRDLGSSELIWASSNAWGQLTARAFSPRISREGGHLIFFASAMAQPSRNYLVHYDLGDGASRIVASNGLDIAHAEISADGRQVACVVSNQVHLWDSTTESLEIVSTGLPGDPPASIASRPSLSGDGSKVAFVAGPADGVAQFYLRDRAVSQTQSITLGQAGSTNRTDLSDTFPALALDGRFAAFESDDPALVADDNNNATDVFLRDLQAGETSLMSERHVDAPSRTGAGRSLLWPRTVSADGQRIAFTSLDSNILPGDTNLVADVYLYDAATGTTIAGSATLSADPENPELMFQNRGHIHSPALSADGRVLAYLNSLSGNDIRVDEIIGLVQFVNLETGFRSEVMLDGSLGGWFPALSSDGRWLALSGDPRFGISDRSLLIAELNQPNPPTRLISGSFGSGVPASGDSIRPLFTPDDRHLLFTSDAYDLVVETTESYQLYAYGMESGTLTLVSRATPFQSFAEPVDQPVVSGDSGHVAFQLLHSRRVYRHSLDAPEQASLLIATNAVEPSISHDGNRVAYRWMSDSNRYSDIVMRDVLGGRTTLVSVNRAASGGGNGDSFSPQITPDGRNVVFASRASDLVDNDPNGQTDIFLRDTATQTTILLSINSSGTASGNSLSSHPILSRDGRTLVFTSFASDLVAGDYNQTRDLFIARLASGDGDADGLDDDWELAFFEGLDRDGTGDFDEDGHTDLEEFLAGTDPTGLQSLLRAITVRRIEGGSTTVLWQAVPGRLYRVQYKATVQAPEWTTLPELIRAESATGSYTDNTTGGASHRFYRVAVE